VGKPIAFCFFTGNLFLIALNKAMATVNPVFLFMKFFKNAVKRLVKIN